MNNLRHGLRARTIILPDERQEDFDEILAGLEQEYQPQSSSEHYLVKEAATAQWKLGRAAAYEACQYEEHPSIEARSAVFSHMTLVTGRLQRMYLKFYKELERIKAARPKPPDQPDQSKQPPKSKKSQEWEKPKSINLHWVNPKTGEKTLQSHWSQEEEDAERRQNEQQTDPPS